MLGGEFAVLQAPMFDSRSLDPFALFDDGFSPVEVGIGGCYIVMVAQMVVVFDEGRVLGLKVAGQEVVLQQNAVLESLVPASPLSGRRCLQCREAILPWVCGWKGAPRT